MTHRTLVSQLRLQRGWSQQQLAQLSGLSARTIQRLENGQPASLETLKSLAAVFEVDIQALQPSAAPDGGPSTVEKTAHDVESTQNRAKKLGRFYRRVRLYAVVMLALLALNAWQGPGHWWVVWPALGWGLALLLRGLKLYAGRASASGCLR